jgi:hypothetical protein
MNRSSQPESAETTVVLDLEPLSPRFAIQEANGSCITLEVKSVHDLMTVASHQPSSSAIPEFPTLLDRIGDSESIVLPGRPSTVEQPHTHVQQVLRDVTVEIGRFQSPGPARLGIVVPSNSTDLQRKRLLKNAHEAGWKHVQLYNRTTAVGRYALESRPAGIWLVLATSYGPAGLSVVRWEAGSLAPLRHHRLDGISAVQLDRQLMRRMIEGSAEQTGVIPECGMYSDSEWHWLRQRARSARQKLNVFGQVDLELPQELTDHSTVTVPLRRAAWLAVIERMCEATVTQIRSAVDAGSDGTGVVHGCVVCGELVSQVGFLRGIQSRLMEMSVLAVPDDSGIRGALQLMKAEGESSTPDDCEDITSPLVDSHQHVTMSLQEFPPWMNPQTAGSQPPSARVTKPSTTKSDPDKETLHASVHVSPKLPESSDQNPPDASLRAGRERTADPLQQAPDSQPVDSDIEMRRAERRKRGQLVEARQIIRQARLFLEQGDLKSLDRSVQLSHQANEKSKDERIFKDVIDIHLKAATSRPPRIETFKDDARWLVCAFGHDPTDAMQLDVAGAIRNRYLTYAEQLSECHTTTAAGEARRALEELLARIPSEQASEWLKQLKSARPESVTLRQES